LLWYDVSLQLLLHNPVETPKISDFGLLIAPGREYRMKIKPTINTAAKSLRYVKQRDRQCAYSGEKYLQFYNTYTQRNCMLECEANYTLLMCNCVPVYLPSTWATTGLFHASLVSFSFSRVFVFRPFTYFCVPCNIFLSFSYFRHSERDCEVTRLVRLASNQEYRANDNVTRNLICIMG
jgi:hypothetical protein